MDSSYGLGHLQWQYRHDQGGTLVSDKSHDQKVAKILRGYQSWSKMAKNFLIFVDSDPLLAHLKKADKSTFKPFPKNKIRDGTEPS